MYKRQVVASIIQGPEGLENLSVFPAAERERELIEKLIQGAAEDSAGIILNSVDGAVIPLLFDGQLWRVQPTSENNLEISVAEHVERRGLLAVVLAWSSCELRLGTLRSRAEPSWRFEAPMRDAFLRIYQNGSVIAETPLRNGASIQLE